MQLSGNAAGVVGAMTVKRVAHATLNVPQIGAVLICGGLDENGTVLNSAELYFPGQGGACVVTGSMNTPRYNHEAVCLDGRVLVIGGQTTGGVYLASAEYFYDVKGIFLDAITGLTSARASFRATLIQDGYVLITGGTDSGDAALNLTEVYVPAAPAEMPGVAPY